MLKGAIHIHSTYSDGELTLGQLRRIYSSGGYDFVCMTDHAEDFDAEKLGTYLDECRALSDERFRFVTGLEYSCDRRMHVLGYGAESLPHTTDPQEVFRLIKSVGGLPVIAHPMDSAFDWIESFDELPHGIEAWNSKYDGRWAPRPATFRMLNRLQKREPAMRAFYGQDLHWKNQFRGLNVMVDSPSLDRQAILSALARGDFFAVKGEIKLPSSGQLPEEMFARFSAVNDATARRRRFMKQTKRMIERLGIKVPEPIKAQLRRIF